jgi:hypothetical protein
MKKYLYILFIFLSIAFYSCYELTVFDGTPLRQYADHVIGFSSQYNLSSPGNWYASQALGPEDVYDTLQDGFGYGDNIKAWSPLTADTQREFLVLGFDTAQTVNTIQIYETWYPGAVDTVYLRNAESKKWKLIYSRPAQQDLPEEARIKSIFLVETTYLVDAIRIALNSPDIIGWNEIDAVAITGQRKD